MTQTPAEEKPRSVGAAGAPVTAKTGQSGECVASFPSQNRETEPRAELSRSRAKSLAGICLFYP